MSIGRVELSGGGGRATQIRDALLTLSRVLASAPPAGVLSDALEIIVDGLGAGRGAAYEATADGLELISHRGVPPALRELIERVPRAEAAKGEARSGFVAGRAARARRAIVEADAAQAAGLDAKAAEASGWVHAIAAPIAIGREVLGVIVVAHPTPEPFGRDALAFIETAANLLALSLDRQRGADRRQERAAAAPSRLAEYGVVGWLAIGVADDLREPLNTLGAQHTEIGERLRQLRPHVGGSKRPMDNLETLLVDADGSLERARKIHDRLMTLVREEDAAVVSLADVAREASALVGPTFAARGLSLDLRARADAFVSGRRAQLTQLVVQLLANALDVAHAGSVVVTVSQDGGRALLTVEEPRPPPSSLPRIRAQDSPMPKPTLGLGLSLARQIAQLHRGSLDVGVSASGGAEVKLSLPSSRAGAKVPGLTPSVQAAPSPELRAEGSLVWVDDDPLFLRSIKRLLKGFRVDTARSAAEAELLLQTATPVRIFCDLGLPDRAGYELHQRMMQSRPEIAKRFVFVTGGALTASVADYLVASGCPTLLKPIRAEEVEALLRFPSAVAPAAPTEPMPQPPEPISSSAPAKSRARTKRRSTASTPLVPEAALPTPPPPLRASEATAPVRRNSARRAATVPNLRRKKED